ncbi:MAG: recombinase family protein [Treponema sp.]|nr:recombinase family protein [Treponema sp.]
MIYGYARVSSKTQLKGNSVEEQRLLLEQNGCQEIIEEQYSGKTTDRPKFRALLERLAEGDTLVVCKLDRFARTVTEGIETVRELFRRKVKVHVLNVGLLEDTPMGNFFITTLLAVAELERCMILERTSAGKEIARTKPDFREGRPVKYSKEQIQLAMSLLDAGNSYSKVVSMTGISKATLVRYRMAFKNKG